MATSLFPPPGHDHHTCIEQAVSRARAVCAEKGVRFTVLRERVFRELASSHRALGAYDLIDRLAGDGRRLAPISVYRIIDVLLDAGLVHRLESRNAYFACLSGHDSTRALLVLLCKACNRVAEAQAPEAWQAIKTLTRATDFFAADSILEVQGLCAHCRDGRRPVN